MRVKRDGTRERRGKKKAPPVSRPHSPAKLLEKKAPSVLFIVRCIHGNRRGQASWACASPCSGD